MGSAVLGLVLIVGLAIGAVLWMTSVPGRSHEGPLPPLTPEQAHLASRLRDHITTIASTPHNTGYPHELERAASYIEAKLSASGYDVHRQTFQAARQEVRNIEVVIEPGATGRDAKTLVVGAHYDSYFQAPGANDNGTGTAGVIELARLLADLKGRSSIRIRLVLFVNEEPPYFKTELMGSFILTRFRAQGRGSLPRDRVLPERGRDGASDHPGHRMVGSLVVRTGRHPRRHGH